MTKHESLAVICEFNPFHNGHGYLLQTIREKHPNSSIICIMSGNYVQRGEPAIADKYLRAKMAVASGADVILELPLPFSIMAACDFSRGAIHIIHQLGQIDRLYFGSECGNTKALTELAQETSKKQFIDTLRKNLLKSPHEIYPKIFSQTYRECYSKSMSFIDESTPNDILGVEYIRELLRIGSRVTPCAIKRKGSGHNSLETTEEYASATALRGFIENNRMDLVAKYMNPSAFGFFCEAMRRKQAPISYECYDKIILSKLKEMNNNGIDFGAYLYCKQLSRKLSREISKATTLTELYAGLKSKNFTLARIKRGVLCCYLEIPKEAIEWDPEYTTVLATTKKGCEYLAKIRKTKKIPLITKAGKLNQLNQPTKEIILNLNADKRFTMFYPSPKEEAFAFKQSPSHREE